MAKHIEELNATAAKYRNPFDCLNAEARKLFHSIEYRQGHLFEDSPSRFDRTIKVLSSLDILYRRWIDRNTQRAMYQTNAPELYELMRSYIQPIILNMPVHPACHGLERGWSCEASLRTHLPMKAMLTFDMKNAYYQVGITQAFDLFYEQCHNPEAAYFLSWITTVSDEGKRVLPIGTPTSPIIFNRALFDFDQALSKKATERGMRYSRWVDDIIISSPQTVSLEEMVGAAAFAKQHYKLSPQKVQFSFPPATALGYVIEKDVTKIPKSHRSAYKSNPIELEELDSISPW